MIRYYWLFGVEFFAIAKIIDLDDDIGLVSFNEKTPTTTPLCDFEDDHEFFKFSYGNYVASEEISEEKYNELKKFLKL